MCKLLHKLPNSYTESNRLERRNLADTTSAINCTDIWSRTPPNETPTKPLYMSSDEINKSFFNFVIWVCCQFKHNLCNIIFNENVEMYNGAIESVFRFIGDVQ